MVLNGIEWKLFRKLVLHSQSNAVNYTDLNVQTLQTRLSYSNETKDLI